MHSLAIMMSLCAVTESERTKLQTTESEQWELLCVGRPRDHAVCDSAVCSLVMKVKSIIWSQMNMRLTCSFLLVLDAFMRCNFSLCCGQSRNHVSEFLVDVPLGESPCR